MIAMLSGEVVQTRLDAIVLMVGGVGYEVMVPVRDSGQFGLEALVIVFIAETIREDAHDLYGYLTSTERDLHIKLVGVNGVGARMAHAILSFYDASALAEIIENEDIVGLSRVSGVGKKTAQRILLDLKGKLVATGGGSSMRDDPAVVALTQLGYSQEQAMQALQKIDQEIDTSERVRQALKGLSR